MDHRRIRDCTKTFSKTNFQHPVLTIKVPRTKKTINWHDVFKTDDVTRLQLDTDQQVH